MNKELDPTEFMDMITPGETYLLSVSGPGLREPLKICTVSTSREAYNAVDMLMVRLCRTGGEFKRYLGMENLLDGDGPGEMYVIKMLYRDECRGTLGIVRVRLERLLSYEELVDWTSDEWPIAP